MINEGIWGLEEKIEPRIEGGRVVVYRELKRFNGDAAVPPGQSVDFQFYVAEFPFRVTVEARAGNIATTERLADGTGGGDGTSAAAPRPPTSAATTLSGPVMGTSPAVAAAPAAAVTSPSMAGDFAPVVTLAPGAGTGGTAQPLATSLAPVIAWEPPPSTGAVARMRGLDLSPFGDLSGPDSFGGDIGNPPPIPPVLPDPVVPFEVTFTPPNGLPPLVFTNPRASEIRQIPHPDVVPARISPEFLDRGRGAWTISVRNINPEATRIRVTVQSKHALAPLQHQTIPLSLLNHLMASVLQKVVPTISFDHGNLVVSTPTHFLALMGIATEYSLGGAVASLIDSFPTFSPVAAAIESRSALVARMTLRGVELAREYDEQIAGLMVKYGHDSPLVTQRKVRRAKALAAVEGAINRLHRMAANRAVFCIVVDGMFTDAPISLEYVGAVARINNIFPQIALVFDERMQVSEVISNLSVDLSPALSKVVLAAGGLVAISAVALNSLFAPLGIVLSIVGGIWLYNWIDDLNVEAMIRERILEKGAAIGHYVKGSFERISAIGASALTCELEANAAADGTDALRISYYDPASAAIPRPRAADVPVPVVEEFDTLRIRGGAARARAPTAVTIQKPGNRVRATEARMPLAREAPGPIPADFVVRNPDSLGLLDQHAAIVVLMMENRSFDHFFHDLAATFPGRGYEAVPPGFTNAAPPGFGQPFGVVKHSDIGIGRSLIFERPHRSLDPHHNYEHTLFQIGGGTEATRGSGEMNGFARDFARGSDSPQVVMSHFGMESLPVYRVLAEHYPVCDRWFAALPVGTYPNRLSALQGTVPFLHNISPYDPAIGYLEDYSVFDLLNMQEIPWKFFESDVGTIRLYDRYRLDVRNVRPISDLDATLRHGRDTGQLPRVMFVEPQFLFGNDDHPPMDIQPGQEFVKQVIGRFIDFGLLDRVLFLLTYDEHGGFFDHVPPPGTPRGPAEWLGQVPSLFPQQPEIAPKCMGVRVPSLVLSKFVSPSAKHQVLDHTSILKTILLHNRRQISSAQFLRFGERVKLGAHFGELMDLQVPRVVDYAAIARAVGYQSGDSWFTSIQPTIVESRLAGLGPAHPASVLRGIAQPRAKRIAGM